MAKKTSCPVTRVEFREKARPVSIAIDGATQLAEVKEFSTGSLGWYLNGKTTIDLNGTPVTVQINASLIVVGSKDLPKEELVEVHSGSASGDVDDNP